MEQFKNAAPQRVAVYLNERGPTTALKAAELADEFLLTHKTWGQEGRERLTDTSFPRTRFSKAEPPGSTFPPMCPRRSNRCNFCRGEGHWKDQCPLLRQKKSMAPSPAPTMLCVSVREKKVVDDAAIDKSGFEPFILDAKVSLVGRDSPVSIKVLFDTGAQHSFIVQSVLPFSSDSQAGDFIVMRGMELGFVPVPPHDVMLECDLAKGVFSVRVRPELPLPGVAMILGNDICRGRVWPTGSVAPVVSSQVLAVASESAAPVSSVGAVARAQSEAACSDMVSVGESALSFGLPVMVS